MICKRIFAIRFEKFRQLLALGSAEARTDSDVLQSAGVVKEAKQ